ncbi:MAG: class I SAM-dependent methyltransferase [Bacteroidetes bacterium]|nr:class I SAM-dependent methyltransferase [Bacteroidota bacterium]MBS1540876.1 class I SAM-dependent methyltransferase [Bacteroidota bacterium]
MKKQIRQSAAFIKGFLLFIRPHFFLGWLRQPLLTTANIIRLSKWIAQQNKAGMNDFYTPGRNYSKRYQLYQHIIDQTNIADQPVDYLEFGVAQGASVKWWASNCTHNDWRFYGFDTFEGLPENWGLYKKGDMSANLPVISDERVHFFKGLFQDSLPSFLSTHPMQSDRRKLIHLDADLFSSTLYVLTSLAPYLKKGDILLFDEFNVPNHEFYAFSLFCDSFYVKTKLIGAVNNYFQVALLIV